MSILYILESGVGLCCVDLWGGAGACGSAAATAATHLGWRGAIAAPSPVTVSTEWH